jgi:di/tricarboxylate transporter
MWERFPKFILGYVVTFVGMLVICLAMRQTGAAKTVTAGTDIFRVLFFVLTFFTIGVTSNFKKL